MHRTRMLVKGTTFFGLALLFVSLFYAKSSHALYMTDRYFLEVSNVGDIAYVFFDNDGTGSTIETISQHSRGGFMFQRGKSGVSHQIVDIGMVPGDSGGPVEIGQYLLPGIHRLRFIVLDYPAASLLSGPSPQTVSLSWKVGKNEDTLFQDEFYGAGMLPCNTPQCPGNAVIVYDYMFVFEVKGCVPDLGAATYRWLYPENVVTNMPSGVESASVEEESLTLEEGEPFAVSLKLDPGNMGDQEADWWFVLLTPDGKFWSFVWPTGWKEGLFPTVTAPITEIPVFLGFLSEAQKVNASGGFPLPFFNLGTDDQPPGNYKFIFGIDDVPNGKVDGNIWYDAVEVNVPAN